MSMQNLKFILSITFLAITLFLSSGVPSWFDGLPWANTVETLTLIIAIPCLIILGRDFLPTKFSIIFLTALLILKLTLYLGAPLSGWKVKVSPDLKGLESGKFIRTYFTVWQENVSAILEKGWTDKKQFPIDWFIPRTTTTKIESLNIVAGPLEEKFEKFSLWMNVEGVIRLPPDTQLVVLTQGTKHEEMNAVSLEGENISVPIVHRLAEVQGLERPPSSSRSWLISGNFNYLGDNWGFQPLLIDQDGNIESILMSLPPKAKWK